MLLRALALSPFAVVLFFLAACSEPAEQVAPVVEARVEAVVEAPAVMTGRVIFDGIPMKGVTMREVVVVSEIASETRATLQQQRKLFEAKINPSVIAPDRGEKAVLMSETDAAELGAKLLEMRKSYPRMLVEEKNVGNGRTSRFKSDAELFYRFAAKFKEMSLSNMTPTIESIDEAIQTAGKRIVESTEGRGDQARLQADTDLAWLKQLHDYLKSYLPLNREVILAIESYHEAQEDSSVGDELSTWEGFVQHHSVTLMSEVYSRGLDEAEIADDGSFGLTAEGEIVVRVEYGLYSAYFLPEDPDESRVKVVDIVKPQNLEN